MPLRRASGPWIIPWCLAVLAACSSSPTTVTPPPPPSVAVVTVSPGADTLTAVGATRQLSAIAQDGTGATISGKTFTWSSSAPNVINVDPASGLATAKGPGNATLTATVDGKSGGALLVVDQQVATVTVSPGTVSLAGLGTTQQFTAVAKDANGNPVASVPMLWLSSDPAIVSIDQSGQATTRAPGSAVILAAGKGIPGSAQVTVTQPATQLAITAYPASATEGVQFFTAIQVAVRDANGALVTSSPRLVTLDIGTNPGGGTLIGPKSQVTVGGIATFSGLSIDRAGTGYTLTASATGLTAGVTGNVSVFLNFTQLGAGFAEVCGLTARGEAYCWGANSLGQLGDGTTTTRSNPTRVAVPGGVTFARIHPGVGANNSCALTAFGSGYCWGLGTGGELGNGVIANPSTPQLVSAPAGISFASMSSNGEHSCALTPGGQAYCWGQNGNHQLGDGSIIIRSVPTAVVMPVGVTFTQIGAGSQFSCGLATLGTVYCWGSNVLGQIGDGTFVERAAPTLVTTPGGVKFVSMSVGDAAVCGLTLVGTAFCWGENPSGGLGDGTTTTRPSPVAVTMPGGVTFASVTVGVFATCALTAPGTAYCWGLNAAGQIGDGSTVDRLVPTPVSMPAGVTFSSVTVGFQCTCATTPSLGGYCWGFPPQAGVQSSTPVHIVR